MWNPLRRWRSNISRSSQTPWGARWPILNSVARWRRGSRPRSRLSGSSSSGQTGRRGCVVAFLVGLILSVGVARAEAQIVIGPTGLTFPYADTDLAITGSFQVAFFTCSSVTANPVACAHAPTPTATVTWAKAVVTGTAPVRQILLAAPPASGTLPPFPSGVGWVAQIAATGDPSNPGVAGTSAFSGDSNPFFGSARTPAVPGNVVVK